MSCNGKRERRTFTEEFKRDAVNLVVVEGYSIGAAAMAVNVLDGSVRQWHRKYAPEPEPCGEDASVEELKAENKRLRKQLRDLLRASTFSFLRHQNSPRGKSS